MPRIASVRTASVRNIPFLEVSGYNPLLAVRGSVAEKPEALDEITERSGRSVRNIAHAHCQTDRGFGPIQTLVNGFFLTDRGEPNDWIKGLELGGDGYVTKPSSPRELILRIEAPAAAVGALERKMKFRNWCFSH
jgi:hypothetical protein